MQATEARTGLSLLQERCAALPAVLRAVPRPRPLPPPPYVITGIGASEGPARLLDARLRQRGLAARFTPLSLFAGGGALGEVEGATLVVFSQGLSPNARLALRLRHRFGALVVCTSVSPGAPDEAGRLLARLRDEGAHLHQHPPGAEGELLLRVQGPAAAALLALRLADGAGAQDQGVAEAVAAARLELGGAPLTGRLAFVSSGGYGALCQGLGWKLLEGLWGPEPPHWDVLQVAHGPLQSLYHGDEATLVLVLARPDDPAPLLYGRLEAALDPRRHRVLTMAATLPAPYSFFEHDALCNALLLHLLAERGGDLRAWPGRGRDLPLYQIEEF